MRDGEKVLPRVRLGFNAILLLSKKHEGVINFHRIHSGGTDAFTLS